MRVLILGGTAEARALAGTLVDRDLDVVSSLAGRVSTPRLPAGDTRVGGFGGVDGLATFLRDQGVERVIDATHPFATTMTRHGVEAARLVGIPFVRYARPGWASHPRAATWTWVSSYDEAREAAGRIGRRPFLTTGRQTLPHFLEQWSEREVLVRVVEPLAEEPPARWRVVLDRGPYHLDGERALISGARVDVLLTKDSGGAYTAAKLSAADELGIPVVVVSRPDLPSGACEVATLEAAVDWVLGPGSAQERANSGPERDHRAHGRP